MYIYLFFMIIYILVRIMKINYLSILEFQLKIVSILLIWMFLNYYHVNNSM